MPVDLQELRGRFVNAISLVDVIFLNNLCDKLEYHMYVCMYVCRITRDIYIKHL
jgi:hypothetical protein